MLNSTPVDVFTISSNNYLGMTRVFAESYLEHHPGATVYVCLVDTLDSRVPYDDFPFEIILAHELDIPAFRNFAFRYDILELNTAVKPFVIKYLRDVRGLDRVFYFDPDILVHDRLAGLEKALSEHLAVLTPHLTKPLDNVCRPPERVIGMCGIYNLGFLGLRLDDSTATFLDWWCDRLYRFCINDLSNGMFVDQSWMDFAPAYLASVAIVRDPIYNIAYWNLPHRFPMNVDDYWAVDGNRVGFFHFSGVDLKQIDVISKHQDRLDLWSRPELRPLFEHYAGLVRASGQYELRSLPYAYHCFTGTDIAIPRSARVALQETDPDGLRWADPFDPGCDDAYLDWLVEPLYFGAAVTHRAALFMWRERADLRDAFPRIDGEDLSRFMTWYLDGGAAQADINDVFVEPLRALWESNPARSAAEEDQARLEAIDLGDPGEHADWLNQPAGDGGDGAALTTRLTTLIHGMRPDVQRLYPDPLGHDRQAFAYWMVVHGAPQHGLHPDLVRPLRQSLPLKSRFALSLKRVPCDGRNRGPVWAGSAVTRAVRRRPIERPESESTRRSTVVPGVNLVGYFEGERGGRSLAPGLGELCQRAGMPWVAVALDHELPDLMTSEQIRHLRGAPFPVTVLDLAAEQYEHVVSTLPFGTRMGGGLVGYLSDSPETLHPDLLRCLDEVWVPTQAAQRLLADRLLIPVHHIPYVTAPPAVAAEPSALDGVDLDEGLFWFVASATAEDRDADRVASAAIDCVRKLVAAGRSDIGLCLLTGGRPAKKVDHLPIRVLDQPVGLERWRSVLDACDGLLSLCPSPRFDQRLASARAQGKPIVARRLAILDDRYTSGGLFDATDIGENPAVLVAPAAAAMAAVVDRSGEGPVGRQPLLNETQGEVDEWLRHITRLAGRS